MVKKIVLIGLLFLGVLNATITTRTTITTSKNVYTSDESIVTRFSDMTGAQSDWIAIYPAGSEATWSNMIQWERKKAVSGTHTFNALPAGEYEVRAFFNNSFNIEASKAFSVQDGNADPVVVTMSKASYTSNEAPVVTFENMTGAQSDWIAIYPAGSEATWSNMIQWERKKAVNGTHTFNALPAGEYEVRAFFNNSFNIEASKAFTVENEDENVNEVILSMSKATYTTNEAPVVTFENMTGAQSDWIAIYPAGSEATWSNMIQWERKKAVNGTHTFKPLPVGDYEVRAFFNNSFNFEASKIFSVKAVEENHQIVKLYEDAENGFDQEWHSTNVPVTIINEGAAGSSHSIHAERGSGSYFYFGNPDKKMKFLELDTRIGTASHLGNFGVIVSTKNGDRRILFSSYLNHMTDGENDFSGNAVPSEPFTSGDGYYHNHPGPTDYYLETQDGTFVHYKINIEEKLRILEPDNELLSIKTFTSAGGDFDNIKLISD